MVNKEMEYGEKLVILEILALQMFLDKLFNLLNFRFLSEEWES